jgi:hypothetical protein
MREIEFRVWDGELMHNVSELIFCMGPKLDGKGLKFYGPGVGQGWIDGENIHLMQYTGLKDKNSKEIYDGDIVQNLRGIKNKVYWEPEILAWNCERFRDRSNRKSYLMLYELDDVATLEVIGNIYENPELLEGEKNE